MNDTISIIIPVYNVEKYLPQCLNSVLNQSYNNFELVLVDDGSTDASGIICDELAKKDNRIRVIHQQNGGAAVARNTGLDWVFNNSYSQWIMFIDSDDWIHSKCLELMLKASMEFGTKLSRCFRVSVEDIVADVDVNYAPTCCLPQQAYFLNNSGAAPWGKLYRKDLFKDIRYPTSKFAEDMFTTYKLFFQCEEVAVLENELYYYRYNPDSLTRSNWKPNRFDEFDAFEEQLIFFKNKKIKEVLGKLIDRYMMAIATQFSDISKSSLTDEEKTKYTKVIQKKMRSVIYRHPIVTLKSFKKNAYCFTIAFPKCMSVYWKFKSLFSKKDK